MLAFTVLVLWTVLSYGFVQRIQRGDPKKIYCILMFVATVLLQGLRSIYIGGVDTNLVYAPGFYRVQTISFSNIPKRFSKDIAFYYLTKVFTLFCKDYHIYLFVISCFVVGTFSYFIYQNSEQPALSYILYFALGYYAVGFQMLRHVMAVSVILFAYKPLRERKPIAFIVIVLLAACFHSSALVFLIAYPLVRMKINWKQWVGIIAVIAATYVARVHIVNIVNSIISGMDRYARYASGAVQLSLVGAFILLCVYTVSYFFAFQIVNQDEELQILFNLSAISIAFMALVTVVGEFHRISMFFGIFNTILLPNAWKGYNAKDMNAKVMLLLGMYAVFIAYFLFIGLENYDLTTYAFMWSE